MNIDKILKEFDEKFTERMISDMRYTKNNLGLMADIMKFIRQALEDQKREWLEWALGCVPKEKKIKSFKEFTENKEFKTATELMFMNQEYQKYKFIQNYWNACLEQTKKNIKGKNVNRQNIHKRKKPRRQIQKFITR